MEKTKITIFIPNYNKEKYITQTLNSILVQKTDFKYKILIIDDASTDNSVKIIKEFIKKYPHKIQLLQNKKNLRCTATSLKGYKHIKTEYFCVLDSDDYWIDKNKLQKAIDFLDNHKDFTLYMSNNYIKEKSKKLYPYINHESYDFDFDHLKDAVFGHTSGTIFRNVIFNKYIPKEAYDAIGTKYEDIYEGDSFRNIIHLNAGKAHFENNIESVYRITGNGIWTSLNIFRQNSLNAIYFMKMFIFFNKKQPDFFINMCWYFCKKNIDLLINNKEVTVNGDICEFKNILNECLSNKISKLKFKNKIKIKLYLIGFNLINNQIIKIKLLNRIKTSIGN